MNLHVAHVLYSESWGGLELYAVNYIHELIKSGVKCTLFCPKNSRVHNEAIQLEIPVSNLSKWKLPIALKKFSHVHAHQRQDLPIIRIGIRKTQIFIYSLYMMAPPKKDAYHKWIYSRINAITSSSEYVCNDIKKNFPVPHERVHLVRYGRSSIPNLPENEIKEIHQKWNHSQNRLIFGSLCRIDLGKGIADILSALDLLNEDTLNKMEVWFVGEPTLLKLTSDGAPIYEKQSEILYSKLKNYSESSRYKSVIKLIPFQKKYHAYLKSFDVFILGSPNETYSIAVIDAMQSGLPVIGANGGGTTEQIGRNERGYLFAPANPGAIAQAFQYYIKNPQHIKLQGETANNWANQEHQWSKTIEVTKKLYQIK